MKRVAKWGRRLARWAAGAVAVLALLLALGIGAFRLAIDLLPGYQQRIVDRVRETTGLRLEFDSVHGRIGRYGPEVVFRGARVLPATGDAPLVSAASGRASLSILRSIWYRRIEIGRVLLVRPRLNFVIHTDGTVELVGQSALQADPATRRPMSLERLPRGRFAVSEATLDVLDLRARQGRFELTGVNVEMVRSGNRVTLTGQMELPEHLGAAIEFEAEAEGDLEDAKSLEWKARLDAGELDLEQWAALLPDSFAVPVAGHGSIELSGRGIGRELNALRVEPAIDDLRLPGGGAEFTRIAGDIRILRDDSMISVRASGLELSRAGAPWRPTNLEAKLTRRDGRLSAVDARADYLRIENLAAFSSLLPAGKLRDTLAALAPQGELFGLDISVTDTGPRRLPDITGRLRFSNVGVEPLGRAAGFSGLDGTIDGRGAKGVVHLATRDGLIRWPLQWRALAELRTADGRVEWSRFNDGVRIWLDDARVDTGHGTAEGQLRMVLRPGELPLMDLQATAHDFDLTQTWRYLQIERLKPKTVAWIDAAFRAGRVTDAKVSITGPTRGFPYREQQGRFVASGHATGINLHFAEGWQQLRGVDSEFAFDGPSMRAVASRGSIGAVAFTHAELHSADLRDAILAVNANARSDAGHAIRLLQASPLAPSFGAAFADLSGSGPVAAELSMYLPMKDFENRVITVKSTLTGVRLSHKLQPVEVTDVAGEMWVRNREIQAPALAGRFLGGPVRLSIATTLLKGGDLDTQINAEGTMQAARLAPVARMPVNAKLTGVADWRGFVTVRRSADREVPARGTMRLSSDLRGLGSGLPEPFAKSADAARPLTINASFDGASGPRIQAQYGRDVHALLQWRDQADEAPIARGIVAFGSQAPVGLPRAAGLWLTGRLDAASLTDLLNLRWEEPRGRPLYEWLGGADLSVQQVEVLGYGFANVSGRLRPGNRAWEVNLTSDAVSGQLVVPYTFPGDVPMVLDLERLHFGERVRSDEGEPDPDPRKLPAIRVDLRDFVFDGRRFGHVRAEFARGTAGMTLNQFTMSHPSFTATGSGSWLMGERGAECRLEFEAESNDVLGFMNAMQLGSLVSGKHGRISATLNWAGPPETSALERLSGRLTIAAENGELTSVEPGAGRVFGLMSLSHLPRRLALDFDDLTGKGLAFDKMRGTFQLTDGEAYTDNLTMRGSAAEIGIAGRTSLRHRTYDQTAVVTGQIGASLGVGGMLAGGPAVGAALLLFSQIFKEPLKGATRGYYRITGSWDDPQVKRIDAREMKENQQAGSPAPAAAGTVPESARE